jgi:hypothetical protein
MAVAACGLAACAAINETVTDRDIDCGDTAEDLCIRIADFALAQRAMSRDLRATSVEIRPTDCPTIPQATGCWRIKAELEQSGGFGIWVYQNPDGTLGHFS